MRGPSVGGVRLTLQAGHVHLPVREMKERWPSDGTLLRLPRIGTPRVADEFELRPIRDIAVREILAHATDGVARVHLPLVATKLKKGPFTIVIPGGTEAVIDFAVEHGRILRDRERTRGDIVPDISLPLGLKFRGIFLDDDGSIIADIARFPNLNLAFLNVARQKVPATLAEMVELLFPDEEPRAPTAEPEEKQGPTLPVDLDGLRVEARDVVPCEEELSLGQAGVFVLGRDTRLDVDYAGDALEIGGYFDVARAELKGEGFRLQGLVASGTGSGALIRTDDKRRLAVELRCDELSIERASIELLDGSRFEFADVSATDVDLVLTRTGGEAHFHVAARAIRGRLAGGVLMVEIGRKAHPISLSEMEFEGAIMISDRKFDIDVEVQGARLEAANFALPLGVAYIDVARTDGSGTGRLIAASGKGWSFAGSLAVNAELAGGRLMTGPLTARLLAGTRVSLAIARLGGGDGLHDLEATGTVEIQLASGSIPIGGNSRIQFSRGASGTLALHALALHPGEEWPTLEAGAQLTAASDGFNLEDLMEFPAGLLEVEVPHIGLEQSGELVLRDIVIALNSVEE